MSRTEVSFDALAGYLPEGSFEPVMALIREYKVQLTITRKRKSVLGDYRHAHAGLGHRISVNGDLNKFSFLITLLHELAHLVTFEKYKHAVQPHGKEWKTFFAGLLADFINKEIFPADIRATLVRSLKSPAASSCADEELLRVLKKYDPRKANVFFVEELSAGEQFCTADKRVFIRGEKIRKRYKCREPATGKWYLFSPVYEVTKPAG